MTREEEIALAKRVESSRREFRRLLLECDCAMRRAVALLRRAHAGKARFDRTVQISAVYQLDEAQIRGRLPQNLKTLDALMVSPASATCCRGGIGSTG